MARPGIGFEESAVSTTVLPVQAEIGALVGNCKRGRTDKPRLVGGWAEFASLYGGFDNTSDTVDLAAAYWDFLQNGGERAYMLRILHADAVQASNLTGFKGKYNNAGVTANLYANNPGAWGNRLAVNSLRDSFTTSSSPTATDGAGNTLPATVSNPNSYNAAQWKLDSLIGVQVGDILDPFDPTTGLASASTVVGPIDPIVVAEIVPDDRAVRFANPNGLLPANWTSGSALKTNSNHKASTFAAEALQDSTDNVLLDSVDGISRGSMLVFSIMSHYPTTKGLAHSLANQVTAIVDRIVGKRVYFTAVTSLVNAADIAATTSAALYLDGNDLDHAVQAATEDSITAVAAGPAGNGIIVSFVLGGALSVAVSNRTITITVNKGVTTWTEIRAAVVSSAAASALITVSADAGAMVPGTDGAAGPLTFTLRGGSRLNVISQEFEMGLTFDGDPIETNFFGNLSMVPTHRDFIGRRVGGALSGSLWVPNDNNPSESIILDDAVLASTDPIMDLPVVQSSLALAAGADGSATNPSDFIGTTSPKSGINLLDDALDFMFFAAPGQTDSILQLAMIDYAEARGDIIAMLDMPPAHTTEETMQNYREVDLGSRSTYAKMFAPYGSIRDPRSIAHAGDVLVVPPTPAMMGLTAKTVMEKGAHRSPGNQRPRWLDVEVNVTPAEHERLNDAGINIIRVVPRAGIRLYGERTLGNYVTDGRQFGNVRMWLNFLKRSLAVSLVEFPFKPASQRTMQELEYAVGKFLLREWQRGALFPDDNATSAFAVKVDAETTSDADLAAGRIIALVKVSPMTPAEQILFRIQSSVGGIAVSEV